jgi:E3 ubiquitin-protein ligase BRE1
MHRDYRRMRKELAAVTASKEAAKAKLERTEKERDSLNQTNSRLLRQAAEKDEMNAKSLSTILHLKQLTDQITKEKENLEQQVKSAQQLSLAARLAANARERVTEEFEKERKALEAKLNFWEQKCEELAKEKEIADGKLSQQKAQMAGLLKDFKKAKDRCDELASESTSHQEEKQKMMEALAIAQREAVEAAQLSERLAQQSGSGGGGLPSRFTAEQLSTQVSVLKQRLVCPVCNHRDKKCILLRCRHMFCRPCVDENIKNRSRKCPACGQRFDTKDVQDVWL